MQAGFPLLKPASQVSGCLQQECWQSQVLADGLPRTAGSGEGPAALRSSQEAEWLTHAYVTRQVLEAMCLPYLLQCICCTNLQRSATATSGTVANLEPSQNAQTSSQMLGVLPGSDLSWSLQGSCDD